MIIRFTQEEQNELKSIERYYEDQIESLYNSLLLSGESLKESTEERPDLQNVLKEVRTLDSKRVKAIKAKFTEMEDRRFSKISGSPKKIINNAHAQTAAIIKKLQALVSSYKPMTDQEWQELISNAKQEEPRKKDNQILEEIEPIAIVFYDVLPEIQNTSGEVTSLNETQIIEIIKKDLHRHYERLDKRSCADLDIFITESVSDLFKSRKEKNIVLALPPNGYFKMIHNKTIDAIPQIEKADLVKDEILGTFYVQVGSERIDFTNDDAMIIKLGVETHKLLAIALIKFSENTSQNIVTIQTEEYLQFTRPNIKNINSINTNINRIRGYLDTIQTMNIPFKKSGKGGKRQLGRVYMFPKSVIDNNYITIELHPDIARALRKNPHMMRYPAGLFKIDPRDPNTYRIGMKIAEYYSLYGNVLSGKHNIIGVNTLYNVTDLPDIDNVEGHYKRKIINPLEEALNKLVSEYEILTEWYYVKPKKGKQTPQKRKMNHAEVNQIRNNFDTWNNSYIYFRMKEELESNLIEEAEKYQEKTEKALLEKKQRDAIKAAKAIDKVKNNE